MGNRVKFPVSLSQLMHLPDMVAEAKPDLFDFEDAQFIDQGGAESCSLLADIANIRC